MRIDKTLYLFTHDLRLADNPAFNQAAADTRQLLCLYCWPFEAAQAHSIRKASTYECQPLGEHRHRFIDESLTDLQQALQKRGQKLLITQQNPVTLIKTLVNDCGIEAIYRSVSPGHDEQCYWQHLKDELPATHFFEIESHNLFQSDQLPFDMENLPDTFSKFRKKVEKLSIRRPLRTPDILPEPIAGINYSAITAPHQTEVKNTPFKGGWQAGYHHLENYFKGMAPSHYKETRNALDSWDDSSKFSPWLANGCVSAHQIYARLKDYEQEVTANESTYWLYFELLWREYFYWYSIKHGARLFAFKGIKNEKPLTSFYPGRFKQWQNGTTPFPIVNACMKQLNQTGYMSNRGRQLVASCFVHELELDWRYGAAYFQQQLIDYEVGSNWGNWQYLAGVGTDPRGHRHFDLEKQTSQYDPKGDFIRKWEGYDTSPINTVDAADWPIIDNTNQTF